MTYDIDIEVQFQFRKPLVPRAIDGGTPAVPAQFA